MKLGDLSKAQLLNRAAGPGLGWHVGPFVVRVRTPLADIAEQIAFLYAGYPLVESGDFADHEVSVRPITLLPGRVRIVADGSVIYANISRKIAVPLLEWTLNLCVFHQPNRDLVLHAAVVERDGWAMIMPAIPGSGKSTLCAALVHRQWRLLSDEVAIINRDDGAVMPATRPIGLKDESIDVIRRFAEEAVIGPRWEGTPKGTVAHCLPPEEDIARADESALPRWIIFPEYRAGAETALAPVSRARALIGAAADSFNYSMLGKEGFRALTGLIDKCDCYELSYSNLEEAIAVLDQATASTRATPPPGGSEARLPSIPKPNAPGIDDDRRAKGSPHLPAARLRELILGVLLNPRMMEDLDPREWDILLRTARSMNLLARLAVQADELGIGEKIPDTIRRHLDAGQTIASQHLRVARWEINRVRRALSAVETPVIFLKGAAYILAGLDIARGRLTTDVDLLVRPDALPMVEQTLARWDWSSSEESPLHERYYREWLHELPPMSHRQRGTALDVHHTILPRTDRLRVRPELIFDEAVPFEEGNEQFLIPSPPDLFLHAAVHLFRNGDFEKGLRDLADLHGMLAEFSQSPDFWNRLLRRAVDLDLTGPCYYALRYSEQYFHNPIPGDIADIVQSWCPHWPPLFVMDALVARALFPRYLDRVDTRRNMAVSMLARLYLPKFRVAASPSFWMKRFPMLFGSRKTER